MERNSTERGNSSRRRRMRGSLGLLSPRWQCLRQRGGYQREVAVVIVVMEMAMLLELDR